MRQQVYKKIERKARSRVAVSHTGIAQRKIELIKLNIAVLSGDGIGPEVTAQSIKVLKAIAVEFDHRFVFKKAAVGATAIDQFNDPLPEKTLQLCRDSDAILFDAIGHPKYDNVLKQQ
jgi:isocitrate/isopropylmalate dehydrogenase